MNRKNQRLAVKLNEIIREAASDNVGCDIGHPDFDQIGGPVKCPGCGGQLHPSKEAWSRLAAGSSALVWCKRCRKYFVFVPKRSQ